MDRMIDVLRFRRRRSHIGIGIAMVVLSSGGCTTPLPTSPGGPSGGVPDVPSGGAQVEQYPPLTGPGRVYEYLTSRASGYPPVDSRWVLYDGTGFALQWRGGGQVLGHYEEAGDSIDFDFQGHEATGTLAGDTLTVRYGAWLTLADFVDATYLLVRE